MSRDTVLRERLALRSFDLTVDLYLYPTNAGGRQKPVAIGWGCPCIGDKGLREGWDGSPLFEGEISPGERRRVGYFFLSGQEAAAALIPYGRFYLWEGRFIGEAEIVR